MNGSSGLRRAASPCSDGRRAPASVLMALALAVLAALALALPTTALAEVTQYGHDEEHPGTIYTSLDEAWDAALSGTVVVMDADWHQERAFGVPSGKSAILLMNGHKVYRDGAESSGGSVFWLYEDSRLVLDGELVSQEFTYEGFDGDVTHLSSQTVTCGGLVTGGHSNNSGGGIQMKAGSTLVLINVAVAGNKAYYTNGGGVAMDGSGCSLYMTDSYIEHNACERAWSQGGCGGGVYADDSGATVEMTNSSISYNVSEEGGGLNFDSSDTRLVMEKDSKIDHNTDVGSQHGGGAIYFDESFTLISKDKTASISYNTSKKESGGAITMANDSDGEIEGITFRGNKALDDVGGAIYGDFGDFTISDCHFEGNEAADEGGAVYSAGDDFTVARSIFLENKSSKAGGALYLSHSGSVVDGCFFEGNTSADNGGALYLNQTGCTVSACNFRGNSATGSSSKGGAIYNNAMSNTFDAVYVTGNTATSEGGGMFTHYQDNVTLKGVVRIYGNTRGALEGGNADDLFLDDNGAATTIYAYALGNVEATSLIGVRTGMTTKRWIAKDMTNYIPGTYFLDLPGSFHLEYSASDKKLYQVPAGITFKVTVNGEGDKKYYQGDTVTVDVADFLDNTIFLNWDESASSGLWNLDEVLADPKSATLTFTMPGNDVNFAAACVSQQTYVWIQVEAPTPGVDLPQTTTLNYKRADGEYANATVSVSWSKQVGSTLKAVSGVAEYGATYVARLTVAQDLDAGLAFAPDLPNTGLVRLFFGDDTKTSRMAKASVNKTTGALTITSTAYTTANKQLVSLDPIPVVSVEGNTSFEEFNKLLPREVTGTADDGSTVKVRLSFSSDQYGELGLLDEGGDVKQPADGTSFDTYTVSADVVAWYYDGVTARGDTPVEPFVTVNVYPGDYRVTFDAADGTDPTKVMVERGGALARPADPVREGYDFLGWYAGDSDTAYDFTATVTSNFTLTAKWAQSEYTVKFDADGGIPTPAAQTLKWGETVCEPEQAPTRDYAIFLGWYAEGSDVAYDFATPVTSNLKLVAIWDVVTYKLTFDPNNGEAPFVCEVRHGSTCDVPESPTREGMTFAGWVTEDGWEWDFSTRITSDVKLTAIWAQAVPTGFKDVVEGDWFYDYVGTAAALGLMTGYTEGTGAYTGYFGPQDTLTRGQVATVLWRIAGRPSASGSGTFDDVVPGWFYSEAVEWCADQGIVTGYKSGLNAGRFCPEREVSREELAVMVYRFAQWAQVNTSDAPTAAFEKCVDGASVASWAHDAAVWCAAADVMSGKDTAEGVKRLDPQQGATRAQAAKIFVRVYSLATGQLEPYQAAQDSAVEAQQDQAETTFEDVATFDVVDELVEATEGAAGETTAEQPAEAEQATDGVAADEPSEPAFEDEQPSDEQAETTDEAAAEQAEGAADADAEFSDVEPAFAA